MANSVFGTYDVVMVIAAKDMEDLSDTIYNIVEKHPNVEHTEVLVSIPWPPADAPAAPQDYNPVLSFNCPSCNSLNEKGATYCHFCGYVF